MKKVILSAIFGVGMLLGTSTSAQAASIVFNGFCDGMTITYDMVTGFASGMNTGTCLGGNLPAAGSAGTVNGVAAVTLSLNNAGTVLSYIIRGNKTWDIVKSDGLGGYILVNSGTWSVGVPLANNATGTPSAK